jgi:hypothetical protein
MNFICYIIYIQFIVRNTSVYRFSYVLANKLAISLEEERPSIIQLHQPISCKDVGTRGAGSAARLPQLLEWGASLPQLLSAYFHNKNGALTINE